MYKFYMALVALLLFIYPATAQQKTTDTLAVSKQKFTSIRVGLNAANILGKDMRSNDFLVGAHVGLSHLSMESETFGIQAEVQYSYQGAKSKSEELLLQYITIPVVAKYFIAPDVSLFGGGYGGLLIAQKYKTESRSTSTNLEGADYGLAYGISYGDESSFTFSLRHHLGLANVIDKDIRAKNQVIQMSVSYCLSNK